jgi:hypothetical protein
MLSLGQPGTIIETRVGPRAAIQSARRELHVSKLYDYCQKIQQHIERNNLDVFRSRGEIALSCGFLVSLVGPDDPDDPEKIEALRKAAREIFNLEL